MSHPCKNGCFNDIQQRLLELGWETTRLPWQMVKEHQYQIIQVEEDVLGGTVYSIVNLRHDEQIYRGRIPSVPILNGILALIKENYHLEEHDFRFLDAMGQSVRIVPESSPEPSITLTTNLDFPNDARDAHL